MEKEHITNEHCREICTQLGRFFARRNISCEDAMVLSINFITSLSIYLEIDEEEMREILSFVVLMRNEFYKKKSLKEELQSRMESTE